MKVRYKNTGTEACASRFNTYSMDEVLTGDDTVPIGELDVEINGVWMDMRQAFRNKDIISDNYNEWFGVPVKPEDRERGYFL